MTTATIIAYTMYLSLALAVGFIGALVLGVFIDASSRLRGRVFPFVFPLIGIAIALSSLLSGRNLSYGDLLVSMGAVEPVATRWGLRVMTLVVLSASVAAFVTYILDRKRERPGGVVLLAAFGIFLLTNSVLNSIFGTKPGFLHNLFYPLFVFVGAYAVRAFDIETSIRAAKMTLLALLVVSCAAAVLVPDVAVQHPYRGWIPGLTFRLWGVGSNANSIGPLALLYLLVATHQPFKRWWIQYSGLAIGFLVLLLAQSKTAFVATVASLAVLWAYRVWVRLGTAYARGDATLSLVATIVGAMLAAGGLLVIIMTLDIAGMIDRFMESKAGGQLLTLTGRNVLWVIAIDEWNKNPLFGYGPTMWDPAYRQAIGLYFAFSAHNQFMQSLGSAGTMGLLGLCTYLVVLSAYAFGAMRASRGFSLALLLVVLLRCLSEAPLTTNTLFNGDFLTHLILFQVVLGFRAGHRGALQTTVSVEPRLADRTRGVPAV